MKNKIFFILSIIIFINISACNSQHSITNDLNLQNSAEIEEGLVPNIITTNKNIQTKDDQYIDATGRTMFLRGINLGGSTKVPYTPDMASHIREGFFNGKEISFVGRPFPLKDADEHFSRLKAWGYHFLRFLVTWEAIEHEGPGIYDTEYLEYVKAIISKANEYDINVMIDPHQDVYSRYTGGDGAPLWTFELAGMDVTKFKETEAAIVHNTHGDPFPKMVWYTNYYKLGAATMFTLFYGGNDFAPQTLVEGIPIQEFLQMHYINALTQVAEQLKNLPNVIGFELMNEPAAGYIGIENLSEAYHTEIIGNAPTPFEGFQLGAGYTLEVQNNYLGAVSLKDKGKVVLNENKQNVWNNLAGIWEQHGVWFRNEDGSAELLKSDYFSQINGKQVDFNKMYYQPFALKYAKAILAIDSSWAICVDDAIFPYPVPLPDLKNHSHINWINGSHWYDDVTLVKKQYIPFLGLSSDGVIFGKKKVKKHYEKHLAWMESETKEHFGNVPSLLGEFGIPFDMNKRKAFKTGNFNIQAKALDRSIGIAEKNLRSYTLWNYTADNTNERGDQWNGEDLSIYSESQKDNYEGINSGGRALEAAIRPFPKKVNGKLLEYHYDFKTKQLTIRMDVKELSKYPTEIFLPEFTYGDNFKVYSKDARLAFDKTERILLYHPEKTGEHILIVKQ